jgi:hypothetical protein
MGSLASKGKCRMRKLLLGLALTAQLVAAKGLVVTSMLGPHSPQGEWDPSVSWNVHALWTLDQMVMAGPGVGYEGGAGAYLPVTGKLMVRLPAGKQAMPYVDGELGLAVRDVLSDSFLAWKFGAGIDQKLGDRSSVLVGGGFQTHEQFYLRVGLLLEL